MTSLLGNYGTFNDRRTYVIVEDVPEDTSLLCARPLWGPLVFVNDASDARDHCANERNFLSWLRLSSYLAVVSVAILTTFHFGSQPSDLERKLAFPLGLIFWLLSLASLVCGVGNYLMTVMKYSKKAVFVQSGWKTQLVSNPEILGAIIAGTVIFCCILFLVNNAINNP